PAESVIIARRMIAPVAQFFKLAVDGVIAFEPQPLIGIAHRRNMVREIPESQNQIKFRGAVLHVNGLLQLRGHAPPAPAVRDGCREHIGMHNGELARNLASFAFAVHVNAARIDRIIFLRPVEQLQDGNLILGRHFPGGILRMSGQKYEVVAQSQPFEGLANRVQIRSGRIAVFLEAEDYSYLPGGIGRTRRRDIGRRFFDVLDDCLARFILKLGHSGRAKRRSTVAGYRQDSSQTAGRSMYGFHGASILHRPGTGEYSGWTNRYLAQREASSSSPRRLRDTA